MLLGLILLVKGEDCMTSQF